LTCDFWAENARKKCKEKKQQLIPRLHLRVVLLAQGPARRNSFRDRNRFRFGERDFEDVYVLSVADPFELAIKLGGGIVGVAIFVLVFGFGLPLLESVVEIGLGERVERDESEAKGGCVGKKPRWLGLAAFFRRDRRRWRRNTPVKSAKEVRKAPLRRRSKFMASLYG
jgi:hypothetical protein